MTTIGEQLVHVLREAGVTRPPCASTYSPRRPAVKWVASMRGSVSLDVDAREGRRGYPAASRSLHGASRFRKFNGSPRPSGASESVGIVPA